MDSAGDKRLTSTAPIKIEYEDIKKKKKLRTYNVRSMLTTEKLTELEVEELTSINWNVVRVMRS